jgi:hypothetical protein
MTRRSSQAAMAALAATLVLAVLPLAAQEHVYKWKDANGVTQYSSTPPSGVAYTSREIRHEDPAPAAAEAPAEDAGCSTARANLELLESDAKVAVDSDGDGKPDRNIDEQERAAQRELAQAAIKVRCAATPATGD